jgi:hypothetical protein
VGKEFWHSVGTSIKLSFQVGKRTSTNKWECKTSQKQSHFKVAYYKSLPRRVQNKGEP